MNEKCWFIRGFYVAGMWVGRLEYHSEGTSASVGFDWKKALSGRLLGFYHSHPSGLSSPSTRDDKTMSAWVRSEGRPMLCGIFCDGEQRCYVYDRGIRLSIGAREVPSKIVGDWIVVKGGWKK